MLWIQQCLRLVFIQEMNNTAEYYREVIGAVENKLRTILSIALNNDTLLSDDILNTAAELKTICLLRKEFGIRITLTEYQNEKETILQNHIKYLCDGKFFLVHSLPCLQRFSYYTLTFSNVCSIVKNFYTNFNYW